MLVAHRGTFRFMWGDACGDGRSSNIAIRGDGLVIEAGR